MQLARGAPTLRAGERQWPDWKRARATQMLRREATRTGNGQEKSSSMSPIGGEMQIKISLEITSLPLGRPPSEPQRVTSNPGGCGETEDSCALLVGMQSGANRCKTWRFLQKLRMELQRGPAIPLPDIYPEERESRFQGEMCPPPRVFSARRPPRVLRTATQWPRRGRTERPQVRSLHLSPRILRPAREE